MIFLLDTVVLSELRKARPSRKVAHWFKAQKTESLFISVVSIGEVERGIERARKLDAEFAAELEQWLETLLNVYSDRLLPVSANAARLWGRLSAKLGHDGADLLIAATALSHGATVVTRNAKHFVPTGVQVFNPFDDLPGAQMEKAQRARTKRVLQPTAEDARILGAVKKSSVDARRKAIAYGVPFVAGKEMTWDASR